MLQNCVIFLVGGTAYVAIELLWRGRSHASMFVLGGACMVLIGCLNTLAPGLPVPVQGVLGAGIITALELLSGLVVNVAMGLKVWDYSRLPMNFKGQICLEYSIFWVGMALVAVFADDMLRWMLFGAAMPGYSWI